MIEESTKNDAGELSPKKYDIAERITTALKGAMRSRDADTLNACRSIKAALIEKEKENGQPVDDSTAITLFKYLVKSKTKARDIFAENGRPDLAAENQLEIDILNSYLPAQMTQEDVRYALESIVKDNGLYKKANMGAVMKIFSEQHPDEDRKLASTLLQQILI